ncbi:uncharacterized protein LOC110873606 isoform X1 [Helianthus annuus]|uniref:uncharacterized protein LOC110873606 isoform X1 n=1 Tax=Helianthus annuus TaxID=4232 RepID=UPI000B9090F4|nr:uncharacterized protein LOC110873606 isoform X1 [Helianthus annuus]XP_035831748.1 uncharacterized protein LOC110873606 isoform X1 [Helianthus annuus]XP_035831749.1 uncharacterized protein LOC110873606 isoform X2 [Helianthus annuus]XP_035831750.1 uncharacterized protein LOC110873606 isoform X1 [Helianthus annuus]
MVSQYVNTPSPSGTSDGDFELVRSNLLDNLFTEFEICVNKIYNTLTESCVMFSESDLLKRKAIEWKEIIKKHLIVEDEKEKEGDDVEKGNKNVEAEEDVAEAAEPIDLQKASVSLVGDNTPANVQNKDGITQYTSPFSPLTLSVAEVDRVVEGVQSEKTPETRFNVSVIEAVNLSTRLADVVTDEECNDVTQPDQRGGLPRPKRTIIFPDALRSPYVERTVSLRNGRDKSEDTLARCIFCVVGNV